MADKSIWKKTLSLIFYDDPPAVKTPDNKQDAMAQTREALDKLDKVPPQNSATQTGKPPSKQPLSSVVNNFIPQEAVKQALANQAAHPESIDFNDLYQTVCKSSISIFKVEEILNEPELQNLPKDTRSKAVAVTLRTIGSSVEDIIQDAYLKDQALDQAELTQRQQIQRQKDENKARLQAIQQEVDDYLKMKNTELEALREENFKLDQDLHLWVAAKLKEEKRIFDILSYFVADDSVNITLGENLPGPSTA